jgi:hypothetical protein
MIKSFFTACCFLVFFSARSQPAASRPVGRHSSASGETGSRSSRPQSAPVKADLPTPWTDLAKSAVLPFPEYPRPQMQRKEWLCLNGKWDYAGGKDYPDASAPESPYAFDKLPEQILVPYAPESYLSGIKRKQEINMWYRRVFTIPKDWKTRHILIHFGAADHTATLFVNGRKAGSHTGGYDSFDFDITPYLQPGKNTLIVAAHDLNDGRSPSGKNGPRGDYTFTSGIWQTVWIEPVQEEYITGMLLTPDPEGGRLKLKINTSKDGLSVEAIALNGKAVVSKGGAAGGEVFYLPIEHPVLWSPDHPFLYDLTLRVKDRQGRIVDEVSAYFGMRSVAVGELKGMKRTMLNGQFLLQLGLLDQGYWPDGIYTAPTDAALKSDIEFSKRAGFNMIRKHMKTEPQRWYYWADKLGLLVWQDMPSIWYQDEDTAVTRGNFRHELQRLIDDHYNSPSIVTWVPFNENWGGFDIREITDWVKAYDPSRLVNGNTGFNNNPTYQKAYGDPGNGDFVDTHIYAAPLYRASVPDKHRAGALGEFGGVGLFVRDHMWPVMNNAYEIVPTKQELTDKYVMMLDQVEQLVKYKGLSVALYTQTTDVEHEINGLLTYDRRVEKMNIAQVKAINDAVIRTSKDLNKEKP